MNENYLSVNSFSLTLLHCSSKSSIRFKTEKVVGGYLTLRAHSMNISTSTAVNYVNVPPLPQFQFGPGRCSIFNYVNLSQHFSLNLIFHQSNSDVSGLDNIIVIIVIMPIIKVIITIEK